MIDFADAWELLEVGERVRVTNEQPEPADKDSPLHCIWRSHNIERGWVVEKLDGPPRAFLIRLPKTRRGEVRFEIAEGGGHLFEELDPLPASKDVGGRRATARKRGRFQSLKGGALMAEIEAMIDSRLKEMLGRLNPELSSDEINRLVEGG